MKKNQIYVSLFTIALSIVLVSSAWAEPYRPDVKIKVLSEYPSYDGRNTRKQAWEIVPVFVSENTWDLSFIAVESSAGALCKLTLEKDSEKSGLSIQWEGMGQKDKIAAENLFLKPGFPAPCDILPVDTDLRDSNFTETSDAAGYKFVKNYTVSKTEVVVEDAVESGWIKEGSGNFEKLAMITVQDDKGKSVVKQLWAPESSWWIYEETPFRRSWRLSQ